MFTILPFWTKELVIFFTFIKFFFFFLDYILFYVQLIQSTFNKYLGKILIPWKMCLLAFGNGLTQILDAQMDKCYIVVVTSSFWGSWNRSETEALCFAAVSLYQLSGVLCIFSSSISVVKLNFSLGFFCFLFCSPFWDWILQRVHQI